MAKCLFSTVNEKEKLFTKYKNYVYIKTIGGGKNI